MLISDKTVMAYDYYQQGCWTGNGSLIGQGIAHRARDRSSGNGSLIGQRIADRARDR
jgi:hypothetical protein